MKLGTIYKSFQHLIAWNTIIIITLSLTSTYVCVYYDIILDMPTGLIGIAIVFPIVFSINAAYTRREQALNNLAVLKSCSAALVAGHKDWVKDNNGEHFERITMLVSEIMNTIKIYLSSDSRDYHKYHNIYRYFSQISLSNEELRKSAISSSELSRLNQYLQQMINSFEQMNNIAHYRTPMTLRAYTLVFLHVFPIIYGPYFAFLTHNFFYFSGFLVSLVYSTVLVSLNNLQDELEDPYDGIGIDDIDFNRQEEYLDVFKVNLLD